MSQGKMQELKEALSNWLSPAKVDKAMIIWHRYYRTVSANKLNNFSDDVVLQFGLAEQAHMLKESLFQLYKLTPPANADVGSTLTLPAFQALPPGLDLNDSPPVVAYPSHVLSFAYLYSPLNNSFDDFASLYNKITQRLKQRAVGLAQLQYLAMHGQLPELYTQHASDKKHLMYASLKQMNLLTNAIYVGLCDEYGPVLVDKKLHKIFSELEDSHPSLNIRALL
jgi:hypothetical protein